MARPIDTRCISPPDRRSVRRSSRWLMRTVLAALATRSSICCGVRLRSLDFSGNARFSRTV
jgi:hypothetical protein